MGIHGQVVGEIEEEVEGKNRRVIIVDYPLSPRPSLCASTPFQRLLEEQLEDAEAFYEEAEKGIHFLPAGPAQVISLAKVTYHAIHDKIRENDYQIYTTRCRVPFSEKLRLGLSLSILRPAHLPILLLLETGMYLLSVVGSIVGNVVQLSSTYLGPSSFLSLALLFFSESPSSSSSSNRSYDGAEGGGVSSLPHRTWDTLTQIGSLDGWLAAASRVLQTSPSSSSPATTASLLSHRAATFLVESFEACTYLDFHRFFTVPILLFILFLGMARAARVAPSYGAQRFLLSSFLPPFLPSFCLLASIYTLPWDNYLVANEVWGYPASRVVAEWMVGVTPGEEVAFFSLGK